MIKLVIIYLFKVYVGPRMVGSEVESQFFLHICHHRISVIIFDKSFYTIMIIWGIQVS